MKYLLAFIVYYLLVPLVIFIYLIFDEGGVAIAYNKTFFYHWQLYFIVALPIAIFLTLLTYFFRLLFPSKIIENTEFKVHYKILITGFLLALPFLLVGIGFITGAGIGHGELYYIYLYSLLIGIFILISTFILSFIKNKKTARRIVLILLFLLLIFFLISWYLRCCNY